ncbi:methionine--tRNA ligase [Halobacteriovorax sp. JY17]|uniref:methionine--tRNA ligase n=1 Tax=Halobacteriovorax sp. JY17 TaxID=2014617 RepID=UPI000C37AAB8|nr:methionine--tRNA ligase [Halobacteriovorax sp. JY17]PIK13646.1 MAG: methionine--tRNA ligase [Halobacteriovorax sp. JY17]
MQKKKFLITAALPYANGPIHFGHMAGAYLASDVYNRHRKLQGHKTLFISGSDEHGVAIMLNAKKVGEDYQEYVNKWHKEHGELFKDFGVDFDFFGQTSAEYHKEEVIKWFKNLHEKGYIEPKDSQQLYCNDCNNHLPDRFVEGTCYKCGYENARGDECPNCGEFIDPVKLTKTVCKICSSNNISEVTVTQYYICLSKYHTEYRKWLETKSESWRKTVYPYVDSLTKESLHDRAITRDIDWGIDVPLPNTEGKKLYVWFDAPIGYVSNTKKFLEDSGSKEDYLKDWWNNDEVELTHFIGKDNIIFHTVIFPTMSLASGICHAADQVPANQFLNLEGKQFSKSTGHYVDAAKAVAKFGQNALRYYLISILPEQTDSSFSWEQLQAKVNNELANNIGNFLNRCLKFTQKNWEEGMPANYYQGFTGSEAANKLSADIKELNELVDGYSVKKGIEKVMFIGQSANNFFSDNAPWAQIKVDKDLAGQTLAYSSIYALCLGVIMKPFLPELSASILSHYKNVVSYEQQMSIYSGDLSVIDEIFKNGHHLTEEVVALVPKIEKELIEEELAELEAKK